MKLTPIAAAALLAVCLACPLLAEGGEPPRSQAQILAWRSRNRPSMLTKVDGKRSADAITPCVWAFRPACSSLV